MNNLYKRIGLDSPTNDPAVIRRGVRAVQQLNPPAAKAAEHILLDPRRKAVYDRAFEVVARIGEVRSNLGLTRTTAWLETHSSDFDTLPHPVPAPPSPTAPRSESDMITGCVCWVIGVAVLIGLLVTCLKLIANDERARAAKLAAPGNTAILQVTPEPAPVPQRREDPAVTRAKEFVKARARSGERVLSDAEVDSYASRLTAQQSDPAPTTGVLYRRFPASSFAPFEVRTKRGSNYYIKVADALDASTVLTAFIRGGEPFGTTLPVGKYRVRYAAGEKWYGSMLDFGLTASYSRCEDLFEFQKTFDGYSGYTLELILQQNGNLSTSRIDPNEF